MREEGGTMDAQGTRTQGALCWWDQPVFSGERWLEDGLWHLTADELDILVVADTPEEATHKLLHAVFDLARFLVELPGDEITEDESELMTFIFGRLGPVWLRHHDHKRGASASRMLKRVRRVIRSRSGDRARRWDGAAWGPSAHSGSVAASHA